MKRRYCKKCKILIETSECPICKSSDFTSNFQGRIFVLDTDKSSIAKKMNINNEGEYAIKVR